MNLIITLQFFEDDSASFDPFAKFFDDHTLVLVAILSGTVESVGSAKPLFRGTPL